MNALPKMAIGNLLIDILAGSAMSAVGSPASVRQPVIVELAPSGTNDASIGC